ncbi:HPP family protein, partial [Candidatus Pelagibacter sp.]|nr:HPP family protein [Candidatus Pelagibacter sp.]
VFFGHLLTAFVGVVFVNYIPLPIYINIALAVGVGVFLMILLNVVHPPGKPVLFAKIKGKQKAIFGLPGNPMSSAACFRFFVYPYIENLLGLHEEIPVRAILKNEFVKKKSFTRFAKSKLNTTKNGKIEVEILKGQESFRIKSFVKSNIWALLPAGKSKFKKGDIVDCFLPNHSNQALL